MLYLLCVYCVQVIKLLLTYSESEGGYGDLYDALLTLMVTGVDDVSSMGPLQSRILVSVCVHLCVRVHCVTNFSSLLWQHVTVSAFVGIYWDIFHRLGSSCGYFLTTITSQSRYAVCTSVLCDCPSYK